MEYRIGVTAPGSSSGIGGKHVALGALVEGQSTLFRVWSPGALSLELDLEAGGLYTMDRLEDGYHEVRLDGIGEGTRYRIRLNGDKSFPDPASRFQPEGVHGPSMIVDPTRFKWTDDGWRGIPRSELIFYELHVGAFSPEGTFDGVRRRLTHFKELGITAVELMPVAAFPGRWNWGYDHAALYSPSSSYGRPDDLRRLVDEAHGLGLAVYLDVIYNHLGPDGAYVAAFAPMFTGRHKTPWGMAINLDDADSHGVRNLFIDNALHWLREYHIDGLRLDATHAIVDDSPVHFLAELQLAVEEIEEGPPRLLIAEDSRNLNKILVPRERGGYGLAAVWADDFHHQVRHLTAGDSEGYFAHFAGMDARDLAETVASGWYYHGQPSHHSGSPRGTDSAVIDVDQCVICIQNHDQIGNRPLGNRLNHEVAPEVFRAASSLLLFAPETPLLFMGQEWAAGTPFLFFTDHGEALGRQVSEGRRKEFEDFAGFRGAIPDPQDPQTFERSKLDWAELDDELHAGTLRLYQDLLNLRKRLGRRADARAHGPHSMSVTRGSFELIVAFRGDEKIAVDEGVRIELHTEQDEYLIQSQPPDVGDGFIRFSRAGAVILTHQ